MWVLPSEAPPGYGGFPPRATRAAQSIHKEATMKKKGAKAKKGGKARDLSVRKGGSVKGGLKALRARE
jgi:hypothetical protein